MMLDFSTELAPLTSAETYEVLVDALDLRSGFGLLFLQCAPAEADRLIPKIRKDLPDKNIGVLRLKEPIDNLFDLVAEREDRSRLNVLFILDLDKSLKSDVKPGYEAGYGGLGGYYNLNTVPPILSHLNQQRENFRDHFRNICFVFVLPKFGIQYFIRRAPDFFDWNSGLFELPDELNRGNSGNITLAIVLIPIHNQLLDQGNSLCDLGKYREAIAAYDQALAIKPDKDEAFYNKGNALRNLGRYEEAIAAYDQALAVKPELHEALDNKGNALSNLGRYEEAIAAYDQALAVKPELHEALNNKGNALSNLGRYEEAIAAYDQALAIKPDQDKAFYNKGNALRNLGRYEEEIAAYDQALAIKPDQDKAFYNKGSALSDLGRNEEAIAAYDQALAIKPDQHQALNNKGIALGNLGRYEEAIAAYDQALAIKPGEANSYYNKSCCWSLSGNSELAFANLKTAISLDAEYQEMAKTDPDFDAIRDHQKFQQLLAE